MIQDKLKINDEFTLHMIFLFFASIVFIYKKIDEKITSFFSSGASFWTSVSSSPSSASWLNKSSFRSSFGSAKRTFVAVFSPWWWWSMIVCTYGLTRKHLLLPEQTPNILKLKRLNLWEKKNLNLIFAWLIINLNSFKTKITFIYNKKL